ncbi:hypothetical protein M7I_4390 [Glarea lozoyensis 74030]|uniref:Uncharacterized protein n=1 Tax=Glarea lozoyensis (strain ATCC 74030 / MF5533) TaxID=1104152 RepID=H0EP23_GLAL7|nr:hypothetical protein M7I_4390 [Glarea lozoyensis 74030]
MGGSMTLESASHANQTVWFGSASASSYVVSARQINGPGFRGCRGGSKSSASKQQAEATQHQAFQLPHKPFQESS